MNSCCICYAMLAWTVSLLLACFSLCLSNFIFLILFSFSIFYFTLCITRRVREVPAGLISCSVERWQGAAGVPPTYLYM